MGNILTYTLNIYGIVAHMYINIFTYPCSHTHTHTHTHTHASSFAHTYNSQSRLPFFLLTPHKGISHGFFLTENTKF